MASVKIHATVASVVVAVLFVVGAVHPSHAFIPPDDGAISRYTRAAPAPSPRPSPLPLPPAQPVIIVQGLIYCKSCKLRGYNSGMDASPLPNATVSLVCYGDEVRKYRVLNQTSTPADRNGYFMVMVYDLKMFDRHSCRLYLRSSPTALCAAPFLPSNRKLGLTVVREKVDNVPRGTVAVYHPSTTALMYAPGAGGKCPPY